MKNTTWTWQTDDPDIVPESEYDTKELLIAHLMEIEKMMKKLVKFFSQYL